MNQMQDRRIDNRLLCADLVELIWCDSSGVERRRIGNLEDISLFGMRLQLESPLCTGTRVRVLYGDGELSGVVRYALRRDSAHFIGVELDKDSGWLRKEFTPKHLLDPHRVMPRAIDRRGNS